MRMCDLPMSMYLIGKSKDQLEMEFLKMADTLNILDKKSMKDGEQRQ